MASASVDAQIHDPLPERFRQPLRGGPATVAVDEPGGAVVGHRGPQAPGCPVARPEQGDRLVSRQDVGKAAADDLAALLFLDARCQGVRQLWRLTTSLIRRPRQIHRAGTTLADRIAAAATLRAPDGTPVSDSEPRLGYLVLFSEIGLSLLVTTLLGALGGHWLDGRLGTAPALAMLGFFFGAGLGTYAIYKLVSRFLATIQ
jgi:hypothetical protein